MKNVFKIYSFCIVALLLINTDLFSQTIIKDKQEVYGKWKKSKSPYIIEGEAIVPKGKVLKIKPGVIIKFKVGTNRDYWDNPDFDLGFLRVNGQLIAKGRKRKMITFTRSGSYGYWGNIFIDTEDDKSLLKWCKVEYSFYVRSIISNDNATGSISFHKSKGTVENCLIVNNGWTGINCKKGSAPLIKNTTIYNNNYGLECNSDSKPNVINTIIWGNNTTLYINGGSKPSISYSLIKKSSLPFSVNDKGNNIFVVDPVFVSPKNGDYRLQKNSPCAKSGKGGYIGALPSK